MTPALHVPTCSAKPDARVRATNGRGIPVAGARRGNVTTSAEEKFVVKSINQKAIGLSSSWMETSPYHCVKRGGERSLIVAVERRVEQGFATR